MRIFFFLIITIFMSCGSDSASTSKAPTAKSTQPVATTKDNSANLSASPKATTKPQQELHANGKNPNADKVGKVPTNFNRHGIPDACDLLTLETIAKYLNIPATGISLADGSSKQNDKSRACFFKWDDEDIKNAGVMVQVQQNQVEEDVPEYLTYMVSSLKTQGENDFNGAGVTKFKDWPDFGDDGAYSTDVGKYVWRVGNDYAFMIAFNTPLLGKKQKRAADAFAKEVMDRMTF